MSFANTEFKQLEKYKKISYEQHKKFLKEYKTLLEKYPELGRILRTPSLTPYKPNRTKAQDTVTVLVIRCEFQPDTNPLTSGDGTMCDTPKGSMYNPDGTHSLDYDPPHDSIYFSCLMSALRDYYLKVSYGKLLIKYTIAPKGFFNAYRLPHKMEYYGAPDNFVLGLFTLFRDAILACDADTNFRVGDYDYFIILHAGCSWQAQAPFMDTPYDIFAAYIPYADYFPPIITREGKPVYGGIIYPESNWHYYMSFMQGGLAHEFAHALGALDLYDVTLSTMGMGGWALMGTGNWNMMGLVPPRLCAWHRILLGFEKPITITQDTSVYLVRPGLPGTHIIRIPINSHEYFLLENRIAYMHPDTSREDPDSNGFRVWRYGVLTKINDYDISLPTGIDSGGILIWHIDSAKIAQFEDSNMINVGYPKGVDLEEADGIQDFELPILQIWDIDATFYGSPYDAFYKGNNERFDAESSPNSNANEGGNSRITITIGEFGDSTKVTIKFQWQLTGFPKNELGFTDVNSPIAYDLNNDGVKEILLATNPVAQIETTGVEIDTYYIGRIHAFEPNGEPYLGYENGILVDSLPPIISQLTIGDVNGDGKVEIIVPNYSGVAVFTDSGSFIDSISTKEIISSIPVLHDITGDNILDIIVPDDEGYLHAYSMVGNNLTELDGFPFWLGQRTRSGVLVLDSLIYALSGSGKLFLITPHGKVIRSILPENLTFTGSSPIASDIDGDGNKEILVVQGTGDIYAVNSQCTSIVWQRKVPDSTYWYAWLNTSQPALADINKDGLCELIFAFGSKIYVLNQNGAYVDNFPIDTRIYQKTQWDTLHNTLEEYYKYWIISSIVVADIDEDGYKDIIVGLPTGKILAINYLGKPIEYFPIATNGEVYSTPFIDDIDNDGDVDIVYATNKGELGVLDLPGKFEPTHWYTIGANIYHNGVYEFTPEPTYANIFNDKNFYVYPNPARRDGFTIRYELGNGVKSIKFMIFNVAGDILYKFTGDVTPGVHDREVKYTLPRGLYILRAEVKTGSKKLVRFKKFGVM